MPRTSGRAKLIKAIQRQLDRRLQARRLRALYGIDDTAEDELDYALLSHLQLLLQTRYVAPRVQLGYTPRFVWYLCRCSERKFRLSFRMERYFFHRLLELIQDHNAFKVTEGARMMTPPAFQLMVFLKYVGTLGSDGSIDQLGVMFDVSSGVCYDYIDRCSGALFSLYDDVVRWPSERERNDIASRIEDAFDFPKCVRLVDGTLLPLALKPSLNGEDYFSRKGGYALNALLFCDDDARVTYSLAGWPGSTHDIRVWKNSVVCRKSSAHFSSGEYLLGDSAFTPSRTMVPAFKKLTGAVMTQECEFFNKKHAKIRSRTDDCIGLIKGRFQYFRGIRIVISKKCNLMRILRLFSCGIVIHNLLLAAPLPPELEDAVAAERRRAAQFRDEDDDDTESCYEECDDRREQLFYYLIEKDGRF